MGNESRLKAQKNYASARKKIVEANPKGMRTYLTARLHFGSCISIFHEMVIRIFIPM